jgi:hypothetical protein
LSHVSEFLTTFVCIHMYQTKNVPTLIILLRLKNLVHLTIRIAYLSLLRASQACFLYDLTPFWPTSREFFGINSTIDVIS